MYWLSYSSHTSHHPSQTPCLPWNSYATQKLMLNSCKMLQKLCEDFHSVTWSTMDRRETRIFPYPSVFELTGPKGWPLKEEIRMLVKLSEFHNHTRLNRKGDIEIRIVVRMNRLTAWGRRKRPVFLGEGRRERKCDLMPKHRAKKQK